jgi:hypothetical protein
MYPRIVALNQGKSQLPKSLARWRWRRVESVEGAGRESYERLLSWYISRRNFQDYVLRWSSSLSCLASFQKTLAMYSELNAKP